MSKTSAGPVSGDRIKSFIERVEKLLEERAAIGSDIRDVFAEAKGVGYDVKTMRKLIQLRAMDAADRDEAMALLDTYGHAIGMEVGTYAKLPSEEELIDRAARIVREVDACMALVGDQGQPPAIAAICKLLGCSTGKASKLRGLVAKRLEGISRNKTDDREMKDETPPHDPETGEITGQNAAPQSQEEGSADAPVCAAPQPDPEGGEGTGTNSTQGDDDDAVGRHEHAPGMPKAFGASPSGRRRDGEARPDVLRFPARQEGTPAECREEQAQTQVSVGAVASGSERVATTESFLSAQDDDLEPPPFLKRARPAVTA